MKNIYEKINFDEIVQKIEDNKNMTYIDGYHKDPFTEIDYKKGVIEYYFEQEKENCDKVKEEIVEKKQEIEEKAKNIEERKNEIPQKIQECQDKFDKAFTNYKALNTFLSGLQVGSPKYIEIEEKIEELKETMNNAQNEKNDLYNENKKLLVNLKI